MVWGQIALNNIKPCMFKKIGLDSVPNKGHWGVFNAAFTKEVINRL
jgi:hypothetical protein